MSEDRIGTATYSPEDNKLRLYPYARLSKEDYERARSNGFIWAPKQELFVAPMWTPEREDLLLEWCGEVSDEDKTLVERSEERAERFEDYSDKRKEDADQAHAMVSSICEGIPLGQPILIGHHSERRARKDAERIEGGMRKAVKMWETSKYWTDRAKGAIRHAKYKERLDVRARRIKTLEAGKRKWQRAQTEAEHLIRFWEGKLFSKHQTTGERRPIEITEENRAFLCELLGRMPSCGVQVRGVDGQNWYGAWDILRPDEERYKNCPTRTVAELKESALRLQSQLITRHERWLLHYANRIAYERAMLDESGGTATDKTEPEKGGGCKCWASRNHHAYIQKVNKVSVTILDNWGNGGGNFTRTIPFDKLYELVSLAEVEKAKAEGRLKDSQDGTGFYIAGAPFESPPSATAIPKQVPDPNKFDAMRETLKAGVQVVSAPQLFPTPVGVARQMAEVAFDGPWGVEVCAEMNDRMRILEPSAGTGNLLAIIREHLAKPDACQSELVAVEINRNLADQLIRFGYDDVRCANFLECNGDLGKFDRILMNPPFANGSDIKHIEHAITFLNPGGRLVAICANGPRQNEALRPLATEWIDLPEGSFKEQGTNVNTALLVIQH